MAQTSLKEITAVIVALMCAVYGAHAKDVDRALTRGSAASALRSKAAGVELVEVPAGTLISVDLVDPIHTGKNKVGDTFRCRVSEGVWVRNRVVIAPGTVVRGELLEVQRSGRLKKRSKLSLTLRSLQVDGATQTLRTDTLTYKGDKHAGKNVGSFLGGALQGAVMGLLFGGKKGAILGAGAGAGAGAVNGFIKGKQDIEFVQGAQLMFEMTAPVTVPVYPAPVEKPDKSTQDKPVEKDAATKPSS